MLQTKGLPFGLISKTEANKVGGSGGVSDTAAEKVSHALSSKRGSV
jgi:hypothetical protein